LKPLPPKKLKDFTLKKKFRGRKRRRRLLVEKLSKE